MQTSLLEKYKYKEHFVGWHYNNDEECHEKYLAQEAEDDKADNYIGFFNGDFEPVMINVVKQEATLEGLLQRTAVRAAQANPVWGERAAQAIFTFKMKSLIYISKDVLSEK